jgi:hypothetical protein
MHKEVRNVVTNSAHFSLQVFWVHSAYIRAAGSAFARNPTRWGGEGSFWRPSVTSRRRFLAMLFARTTLHDAGTSEAEVMAVGERDLRGCGGFFLSIK